MLRLENYKLEAAIEAIFEASVVFLAHLTTFLQQLLYFHTKCLISAQVLFFYNSTWIDEYYIR